MDYRENWDKIKEAVENTALPTEEDEIICFGTSALGRIAVSVLKEKLHITALCDNDPEKRVGGGELPCISPAQISQYPQPFVLITTSLHIKAISRQLEGMGIRHSGLDAYVIRTHWEEFEGVYRLLNEESKNVYAGVLWCRLTGDAGAGEKYCCADQYFALPKFRYLYRPNEVFVDCGAYVGDTLEKAVEYSSGQLRRIYAFEPCDRTFAALEKRAALLKDLWAMEDGSVICEKKGVGLQSVTMAFRDHPDTPTASSFSIGPSSDGRPVEMVSLDDYFSAKDDRVTFIKADIEGFEWDMLHGAAEVIRRDKPKLAVCIYHSIFDFFRIAAYLKELVPEYRFHVRYHGGVNLCEVVLYCHI